MILSADVHLVLLSSPPRRSLAALDNDLQQGGAKADLPDLNTNQHHTLLTFTLTHSSRRAILLSSLALPRD